MGLQRKGHTVRKSMSPLGRCEENNMPLLGKVSMKGMFASLCIGDLGSHKSRIFHAEPFKRSPGREFEPLGNISQRVFRKACKWEHEVPRS